jgi:DNA-directed RNA polymerase specialized sigma24 family protein
MKKPFRSPTPGPSVGPADFSALYAEYAERVLLFHARRCLDAELAVDLMVETFAEALASRRRFRGTSEAEAAAWLFGIARNQLASFFRRGRAERRALTRLRIQVPAVAEERVGANEICLDRRAQALQRNRLEQLAGGTTGGPRHRVVDQDVDAAEVALELGHRRAGLYGLRQIKRDQGGPAAGVLHRLGGVLCFRSAAVICDGDAGALRTEGHGGCSPDVARCAGDQHAFAFQSEIHRQGDLVRL